MKRINFVLIAIISLFIIECSDATSSTSSTTLTDPGFTYSAKTISSSKSFTFTNLDDCAASTGCMAVYYSGTVGSDTYSAVSVDYRASDRTSIYNLKIYKKSTDSNYTIKLQKNGVVNSTTSSAVTIAANSPSTGLCTITFTGDIIVGATTIKNTDQIVAQMYP